MPDRDDDQSTEGGKNNETTYEVHRAEGDVLFKKGEYQKACQSYTHALDLMGDKDEKDAQGGGKPKRGELSKEEEKLLKDKNEILVSRSKCHLMLGNATAALEDSETALKEDKTFIKALYQKAEALYLQGDFENALVCYHRGNSQRPELQEFRQGINKATEAINNSIGMPESVKLEKRGLEYFYSKQDEDERAKQKKAKGGKTYGKPGKTDNKPKEKQRPKSCKDTKTIKELLGVLYQDREFLDKLLKEEEAMEQKTESSQKIQDLCIEGINYLDSRTDFWRQQKPMYARKRDKMLQKQQLQRGKHGSQTMRYVVKSIEGIDDAQANGDYEKSLRQSKKTLRQVEAMNDDECPDKPEILASLYSYMGNAYLETAKYDLALEYHKKDLELGDKNDMEDSKSRALDNLGRVYARTGSYTQAVEVWEEKLPMSKSDLEKTWLYHEIGRCYLELEKFDKAHEYGELSLEAAKSADDDVWQLNASVLIAQAEVKLKDYNSAVSSFERSLDMARVQGDKPAEEAIKCALEEVNKKIAQMLREEGEDGEDQQQQQQTEEEQKPKTPPKDDDKEKERKKSEEKEKERKKSEDKEKERKKSEDKQEEEQQEAVVEEPESNDKSVKDDKSGKDDSDQQKEDEQIDEQIEDKPPSRQKTTEDK